MGQGNRTTHDRRKRRRQEKETEKELLEYHPLHASTLLTGREKKEVNLVLTETASNDLFHFFPTLSLSFSSSLFLIFLPLPSL